MTTDLTKLPEGWKPATFTHTPGPWFLWQERAMQAEGLIRDEINEELLERYEYSIMAGEPLEVTRGFISGSTSIVKVDADDLDVENEEEGRRIALANARLIAAAPDLLEASILFVEQWMACGPNSDFGRYFMNIRNAHLAAIAKAQPDSKWGRFYLEHVAKAEGRP